MIEQKAKIVGGNVLGRQDAFAVEYEA